MGLTDKLDLLMKERNISKADLARESGVPYTTIDGFYKKGSENAKLSTLKKLCSYFNCTLDYLADDAVHEPPISTETNSPRPSWMISGPTPNLLRTDATAINKELT